MLHTILVYNLQFTVIVILINTSSMQKKMTVWLITFQVGGVLNLFFFLQGVLDLDDMKLRTVVYKYSLYKDYYDI